MHDAGYRGIWFALLTQKCIHEKRREAVGGEGCARQGASVFVSFGKLSHLRAWTLFIISDQIMKNSVSVKLVEVSHTARKR